MNDTRTGDPIKEYDYIIVGAGTAGSTLAARLSEDRDLRILVLEAGGSDKQFWLRLPVGYFKSIYNPKVSHVFKGSPDVGIAGREMDIPRGRVVGGSSSINGLIFIRGQSQDFDDWEALGASGWGWGYGSGTKGDPGPWIGELRNMWVETAQPGLWFTGGNLSQARYFSRLIALQLAQSFRNQSG